MRGIRKIRLFSLLIVATLLAQNAGATSISSVPYDSFGKMLDAGSGSAAVECRVYKGTSDLFTDARQISNRDSAIGLSFFSVGTSKGVSEWSASIESDPICGYADPVFRTVTGSPVQSVDFLLADTTDSGEQSALLWIAGDRKTISGQRYVVRREYVHNGRFTYTDIGTSSVRIARHSWSTDF